MIWLNYLVFCALFVCAPLSAIAQDMCSQLSQIVSAAGGKFKSLEGPHNTRRTELSAGTLILPGATRCTVYNDSGSSSYSCSWDNSDAGSLEAKYASLQATVQSCLHPSGSRIPHISNANVVKQVAFTLSDSIEVTVSNRTTARGPMVELEVARNYD
jgi:hypothetical protein